MEASTDDIATFRRFSREFTRRVGVLDDRYLHHDRPLGEARILYELDQGTSLRELRERLALDAGYLSRVVKKLRQDGLLETRSDADDRRVRLVRLTERGRREVAEQNRRADEAAAGLLGGLDARQRERLTAALHTAEGLMRLSAVDIRPADPDSPEARGALRAYAEEIDRRFPEGYQAGELLPGDALRGERGVFLLAREAGIAIGCGGVRELEPDVGELRHLWIASTARGIGLGRRLLSALEAEAVRHGWKRLRLGTHRALTEAIGLYRGAGYREIEPYGDDPHNHHNFEKSLP
ncbi:GNAT family N-acetyltransferase [Amycolatopsis rhizosphaerae]|uniref:GNAT family N-acetyltransferase n=1 Tax=Amycolatopsis rhizosphaerae TaxID=2053003 RepID=A0A557ZYV2_9PSEU|nr:bifunctional helix-turn-helix transcriptional regulator/GNAT family N-acetyltransferase [Amycolatopsis rhizosphaerae]TVT17193.1 GNAT family N-acetyltransferase [Amycolatopsis rhizosphaerae]